MPGGYSLPGERKNIMDNNKIISMIDEYLTEPHSISREWVQALLVCKDALIQNKKKDTEIDILIRKKEALRDEISEKKAEIERLETKHSEMCIGMKRLKSEARKELFEKIKKEKITHRNLGEIAYIEVIEELLKEMEGEE